MHYTTAVRLILFIITIKSNFRSLLNLHLLLISGVKVKGVETVKLMSHHTRDHVSAENTHFESGGLRNSCIVYALRLYIQDEAGSLSKKDLNPDPKSVKLFDHHCCIL